MFILCGPWCDGDSFLGFAPKLFVFCPFAETCQVSMSACGSCESPENLTNLKTAARFRPICCHQQTFQPFLSHSGSADKPGAI